MPHRSMLSLAGWSIAAVIMLFALLRLAGLEGGASVALAAIGGAATATGLAFAKQKPARLVTDAPNWQAIADGIPGYGWLADSELGVTTLSIGFRKAFGADAIGEASTFERLLHPDDVEEAQVRWRRVAKAASDFHGAYRLRGLDGEHRWYMVSARPQRDSAGDAPGWWGSLVDIHALKSAEEELSAGDKSMRSILDNIPAMISTASANGKQEYNNKSSTEFHGKNYSELNGMQFLDSIHPEDRDGFVAARLYCMENAVPLDRRSRVRRHDGTYRWIQTRSQPVLDASGNVVRWYGITMDIDDQVRAEQALHGAQEQLLRASHVMALAELSASIAHEVNQPLAAVVTNSHACRAWLAADPPNLPRARIAAERMVRDSMAAADVVGRIRALFARKPSPRVTIDLREVVQEVRAMMSGQFSAEGAIVDAKLGPQRLLVVADRIQIQQVLANLFRNAIEAMKANGDAPRLLSITLTREDDGAVLAEVRDTGSGIADPAGLFEPFFTTKNGGMGMGLAICRSIIEAHDGTISVGQNTPRGAVCSFRLPAAGTVPN